MALRQKLAFERLALQMLDMQLRYGEVIHDRPVTLAHEGRCIACAQRIDPGPAYQAHWRNRPTTGFYAHGDCPPLDSDWLLNDEFYQIFDYVVMNIQRCADCNDHPASVRVVVAADPQRFSRGGISLRYVCHTCVNKPSRSRS